MKRIVCLTVAFMICLSGWIGISSACAEGTDEYAAAFSGQGRLTLVPYTPFDLPPELTGPDEDSGISPEAFLGLSPDGKAILFGGYEMKEADSVKTPVSHIIMMRDGEISEFRADAARGDGDPFEKLDRLMKYAGSLPAMEELSWSSDGRYVTLSNMQSASDTSRSMDVPVVDVVDGEFWLADSYSNNLLDEGGGIVFISRFSRTGDYVYYLVYHDGAYRFCRCTPEGGSREVLYELKKGDGQPFTLSSRSNLYEAADGRWILSGISGTGRQVTDGPALVFFSPSRSRWTASAYPTLIPKVISPVRFSYSDVSGYGALTLMNYNTSSAATLAVQDKNILVTDEKNLAITELLKRMNLLRINTNGDFSWDVWCMQRTGENYTDLEMVSAAKYLQYLQLTALGFQPDEYPEGFDVRESLIHPSPVILNVCLSPDGRYALLCVRTVEQDETSHEQVSLLYLLEMESMEVRQVDAPEGTLSQALWAGTAFSRKYLPGMSWNPDGTIILINGKGKLEFFRLTVKN